MAPQIPTRLAHARARPASLATLALAVLLAGCAPSPSPGASPPPSSGTPASATPSDLTQPGRARAAITALQGLDGGLPVIRLTIRPQQATLTVVDEDEARTWSWEDGVVAEVDSDVSYVGQAPFDPAGFAFDDLAGLFAQAAAVAGSAERQELQINEYNQGKVLMTVTTSPESATVFFRADGTMIHALDLASADGIAEALRDTAGDGAQVVGLGLTTANLWVDVRINQDEMEHRVRPAKLPAYTVVRSQRSELAAFSPQLVDPALVASLVASLPGQLGHPDAAVSLAVDTRDGLGYPVLRFTVGTAEADYSPTGQDITSQVS